MSDGVGQAGITVSHSALLPYLDAAKESFCPGGWLSNWVVAAMNDEPKGDGPQRSGMNEQQQLQQGKAHSGCRQL